MDGFLFTSAVTQSEFTGKRLATIASFDAITFAMIFEILAALPPNWTPEWVSDRGIAWVKSIFDVTKQVIDDFGILGLALMTVFQTLKGKARDVEISLLKDRLDRQSQRIQANAEAVTAVALATPTKDPESVIAGEPTA